jgi:hypothetical protein
MIVRCLIIIIVFIVFALIVVLIRIKIIIIATITERRIYCLTQTHILSAASFTDISVV